MLKIRGVIKTDVIRYRTRKPQPICKLRNMKTLNFFSSSTDKKYSFIYSLSIRYVSKLMLQIALFISPFHSNFRLGGWDIIYDTKLKIVLVPLSTYNRWRAHFTLDRLQVFVTFPTGIVQTAFSYYFHWTKCSSSIIILSL